MFATLQLVPDPLAVTATPEILPDGSKSVSVLKFSEEVKATVIASPSLAHSLSLLFEVMLAVAMVGLTKSRENASPLAPGYFVVPSWVVNLRLIVPVPLDGKAASAVILE